MRKSFNTLADHVITQSQWHNLLEGIDIISSKKLKRFKGIKNT
jgi:hypothetical protein